MYLKQLQIINFRGIKELTIEFRKGVNIIIGENNICKTAIIDVLRLAFNIGSERREVYINADDFHVDKYGYRADSIEFHLSFAEISDEDKGVFIDMLSIGENNEAFLKLHICYHITNREGIEKFGFRYWGGDKEGQTIPNELMELFYSVYLGALRDAERYLRPRRGSRLSELFMKLRDMNTQQSLAHSVNQEIQSIEDWQLLISDAKARINEHLDKMTIIPQHVDINFVPFEFKKIVETLKMLTPFFGVVNKEEIARHFGQNNAWRDYFVDSQKDDLVFVDNFQDRLQSSTQLSEEDINFLVTIYQRTHKPFELVQNGLGYNNLIFIATVIGDLLERKKRRIESYIALLIEEPEAHLHPQLQNVLFNYFREMEQGQIQVFITSHSPTITAKTDIDSLIILQYLNELVHATPLRIIDLKDDEKRFLERFLDVTKSQLFFAKGVILVEGISEALLLPTFAKIMGATYNLDKNGIEIVNISGVAFEPFAKLFNSIESNKRLQVKCAILTDDDRNEKGIESPRAQRTKRFRGGLLNVFLAERTLEFELYKQNDNRQIVVDVYKKLHPKFDLDQKQNIEKQALEFMTRIKTNEDKAEFAQILAKELQDNQHFTVPRYIENAIKWVVDENAY